jgi:hypothetical protein
MANFSFDTSTVAPRENTYELLPAGSYPAVVEESDIQALKSGNGSAMVLTFRVVDGQFMGRKIWARLNVRHSNPEAERIAQQQLRELCDAIGLARMQDTTELHNKPVTIRVKIREDKTGQYEPRNEIAGYKQLGGSQGHAHAMVASGVAARASAASMPAAVAAPAAATPPWQKRAA